jgi:hypothetical protein
MRNLETPTTSVFPRFVLPSGKGNPEVFSCAELTTSRDGFEG